MIAFLVLLSCSIALNVFAFIFKKEHVIFPMLSFLTFVSGMFVGYFQGTKVEDMVIAILIVAISFLSFTILWKKQHEF